MVSALFVDVLYVICDVWKKAFSRVLAITERSGSGLYEVPTCMSLLGVGMCVRAWDDVVV